MNNNLKLLVNGIFAGHLSSKTIPRIGEKIVLNENTYIIKDVIYNITLVSHVNKTFHTDEVCLYLE